MRTALVSRSLIAPIVALLSLSSQAGPNPVRCSLSGAGGAVTGTCTELAGEKPLLRLSPAASLRTGRYRRDADPLDIYAGDMRITAGPVPIEIELYRDGTGILRPEGLTWLTVSRWKRSTDALEFDLDPSKPVPPSDLDREILTHAAAILSSEKVWDRADDRVCGPDDKTWSIYCAMLRATGDVTGGIHHRRPAMEVVRQIVDARSKGKAYEHRLRDYNNDRSTSLADVKSLFAEARARMTQAASPDRRFETAINLETTAEDSANVSMGDLDGDGDLDLILAKGRHTPILDRVLINDGKGHFTASDLGPTPDRTYTAALADLDGDSDLDVLTSNDTPDRKLVYLNDGKGRFTIAGTWGVAEWSTRNAAVADLDGDGKIDVIAANRPGPSFVCLGDGNGRFTRACIPIPAESATTIAPADFDKDGFIDLAVPSRDGGQSRIYFNDGKARFSRTAPFGPADAAARVGAAADFDGDGSIDLAVADEKARSLTVYMNDGRGRLTPGFRTANQSKTPYAMTAGDLNDDGHPDIVFGYTEGPHAVFFNDGTGRQFRPIAFGDKAGSAYGFALCDVNGDRIIDIALARSGAPNVLYLGSK